MSYLGNPYTLGPNYNGEATKQFSVANATNTQNAVPMIQVQTQAGTAFTATGTAPSYILTPTPPIQSYATNPRLRVLFSTAGTTGSNTINISGLGILNLMQYASDGTITGAIITAGMLTDVECHGGNAMVLDPLPIANGNSIMPLQTPVLASGAMTVTLNAVTLAFRSANGGSTQMLTSVLSLIIPSGATIGTTSAIQSTFVYAVLYNGGSPQLAVSNIIGALDMYETGLISTTAISSSASSAGVWYSTSAITNSPYRIVGVTVQTEATAGVYATAPSLGGEAFTALMSAGSAQNWVSYTRAPGTIYYNTSTKVRWICPVIGGTASGTGYTKVFVWNAAAGVYVQAACLSTFGGSSFCGFPIPVPAGASYYLDPIIGSAVYNSWTELA